ncbi:MAG: general secretion pathway protein GspH [Oscillatoriales cyanobacterium RM2_1_1]|nr:general secretion pathway protein GspH [Oscillatoriales cyanobacterium SM2_3_0]NJO45765.1 general secretion pathway protein GspH [Oscillatoriales cyanobacterium RM2_1_1]
MNSQAQTLNLSQKLLTLLLLTPFALTGCQLSFSVPKPEDIPGFQGENQASFVMNAMATGQEAYYKANGHFSNSIESLAINFNLETEDYAYSIVTQGDYAQTVVMKAAAKLDNLPSYAGVVTVGQSDGGVMAMANICKTDQPSTQPPALSPNPVPGIGLKCPRGSSPVQ